MGNAHFALCGKSGGGCELGKNQPFNIVTLESFEGESPFIEDWHHLQQNIFTKWKPIPRAIKIHSFYKGMAECEPLRDIKRVCDQHLRSSSPKNEKCAVNLLKPHSAHPVEH